MKTNASSPSLRLSLRTLWYQKDLKLRFLQFQAASQRRLGENLGALGCGQRRFHFERTQENHLHPPHWSPHVHLIVGTNDIDKLKRDLGAAFPGSEQAPKPVMVKECDGNPKVFFYLYRPSFQRRISIEQTERFNRRTKKKRLCRATTYDRLRISERIELALFLDALGPGSRLSFRNARLCQARNSIRLQLVTT